MAWPTRPEASTTARGYGNGHQKARKAAAARHQPTDPCTRCRKPLGVMGPWLHYDHSDDRTRMLGFAHAACNTTAGARKGARKGALVANAKRKGLRRSERW